MWVVNIEMQFKEIDCQSLDWIHLSRVSIKWRALVNTTINILVP
jgi:hypothetical protein